MCLMARCGGMPLEELRPSRTVDARGLFCPLPVYKARQAMLEAKPNEVIELLADDPSAEEDLRRWARRTGNRLLSVERLPDDQHAIRVLIQKAAAPPSDSS